MRVSIFFYTKVHTEAIFYPSEDHGRIVPSKVGDNVGSSPYSEENEDPCEYKKGYSDICLLFSTTGYTVLVVNRHDGFSLAGS